MNQLGDQEICLSHMSITCPSKEGVVSCIMYLGHVYKCMVHRLVHTRYIGTIVCVKWWLFCMLSKYSFENPSDGLKYGEHQLDIWRYVLSMNMSVEQYLEMDVTCPIVWTW
jgi:hypothetical protein